MAADFRDAAERHWEDAGHLLTHTSLANADHLFGLSAECALKAVMVSLGLPLGPYGAPVQRQYLVHINRLWDGFVAFAEGRSGERYTSTMDGRTNPFRDWDVNQRYEHRCVVTQAKIQSHRQAAQITMKILETVVFDGGIV